MNFTNLFLDINIYGIGTRVMTARFLAWMPECLNSANTLLLILVVSFRNSERSFFFLFLFFSNFSYFIERKWKTLLLQNCSHHATYLAGVFKWGHGAQKSVLVLGQRHSCAFVRGDQPQRHLLQLVGVDRSAWEGRAGRRWGVTYVVAWYKKKPKLKEKRKCWNDSIWWINASYIFFTDRKGNSKMRCSSYLCIICWHTRP